MAGSVGEALKSLDFHPKLVSDFAVRTRSGAAVSLVAVAVASLLFLSELRTFLSTEKVEHMEVDDAAAGGSRAGAAVTDKLLRVHFDVSFPSLPCAMLSLDTADASGARTADVLHNVFKRRLDATGYPIGDGERAGELRALKTTQELLKEKQKAIAEGRPVAKPSPTAGAVACGDCYGSAEAGVCCNTCEEVREAYRRKGWQFNMKGVTQCESEGFAGDVNAQLAAKEGCNLYGLLEVPKVPGGFHFAPGHDMQHAYNQVSDLVAFTYDSFNVSHKVNTLYFGPARTPDKARSPLDDRAVTLAEGTGMHQYFVKLVPTITTPLRGPPVLSYQYSVTEHVRKLDRSQAQLEAATGLLPGVFFNYELSPLRVRIEERRRSLGHFLTNCCAILGGVFTVMGLVDALLHRYLKGLAGGRGRRGGAGKLGLAE